MSKKYLLMICSLLWVFFSSQPAAAMKNYTVGVPTPISPSGTILDTTPSYSFSKVVGASQYQYQLFKGGKSIYIVTVAAIDCGATSNCVNTPVTVLDSGLYTWKVRAMVASSWKAYSTAKAFTFPSIPTPIAPTGSSQNTTPTYNFSRILGA